MRADTLSISPSQASFVHTKNHSYDQKEVDSYSCRFFVWRSSVNCGLQNMVTSVRKTWSTRLLRPTIASTYSWREQQDKSRVLCGFPEFLGLLQSNSRTLWWNNNWPWVDGIHSDSLHNRKEYFFTGVVLSAFNLSLRTDSFRVERKAREDDRLSSSHHSTL